MRAMQTQAGIIGIGRNSKTAQRQEEKQRARIEL
jgi:hypothetical protein